MGNERMPTTIYDDVASTSSTIARMNGGSRKRKAPSSPIPDDYSHSPLVEADDEDVEGREDEEEEKEDGDNEIDGEIEGNDEEEDEEENGIPLAWSKSDDCELFKRIQKACPTDDAMKYESRVNHLNWESIKFQDYSAEECKNRWLHVQTHLRNYRILAEVLEDAESWVDGPCYSNLNKRKKNNQQHPDDQPKKPRTSYMEQKDAVLEKQPGLEVKNELASTTMKSPALAANNQLLFKAEKMTEPLKPPATAAAYYVMTHHFKLKNLNPAEIDALWGMVSEKEKKKCIEEHKKRHEDYVREFKKFILTLNSAELRSYRTVMKNRARDQEDGDKESKSISASLKSSEGSSASQNSMANADSISAKSRSQIKPSLKANVKSSTEKLASTTLTSPTLAASQLLFKAEKMTEPLKPPASAATYYVMTHHSQLGELTPAEIDVLWGKVSEKEKKKCIEEHKKRHKDYVREFDEFILILNSAELRSFRTVMKNRARDQEDGDKKSKSTSTFLKSSESSSDSPSKESAASADLKSVKSSSNVNVKSSTEKMDSETLTSLTLAPSHKSLLLAEKMVEPTKIPASAAAYYVMMHQSKLGELSPAEIDVVWIKLSVEQRKKCIEEHSKKFEDYVLELEKFARSLNPAVLKNCARDQEDGDKKSKSIPASSKSPEGSSDSTSKESLASADLKSAKSSSNVNVKSSTEKMASITLTSPTLAASQSLFKAEKMTEPIKPPATAAAHYVMTHHFKLKNLNPAEIDALWGMVSEKEKKKCIEEHKKRHEDYVREFKKFILTLNSAELRSYRIVMRNRARDQEDGDKESSDQESSDEESSDEEKML